MRTRQGSIAIVIVLAVVLVGVVFGAAVRGPWVVTPGSVLGKAVPETVPSAAPDLPTQTLRPDESVKDQWDASWLPAAVTVLAIIAGAIVLLFLARMLFLAIGRARTPGPEAESARGGDIVSTADLPRVEALREGVESAQALLDEAREPGDAVIAAWIALEVSAERSGVARQKSQTPTEFTVSVLSRTTAEQTAVDDLLQLYLVARFSTHRVTRTDVDRAGVCLTRISETLHVDRVSP